MHLNVGEKKQKQMEGLKKANSFGITRSHV